MNSFFLIKEWCKWLKLNYIFPRFNDRTFAKEKLVNDKNIGMRNISKNI